VGTVPATPPVRGVAPAVAQMCCAVGYDDREDDQVDHRVEDPGAAEHLDQHADGVLARRQFQPRAAVSHDALSDDIRHVLSRRLVWRR
jgi:hypothetical protein